MKRPSPAQLIESLRYSISVLELIQVHGPELLRRREHEAGRDGYPAQSMGGGGSSGGSSSSTETAALGKLDKTRQLVDPTGHSIDSVVRAVAEIERIAQTAKGQVLEVFNTEDEMRGRVTTVKECRTCPNPLLGHANGDRRGLCQACYQSYKRWAADKSNTDSTSIETFAVVRKAELNKQKQPA